MFCLRATLAGVDVQFCLSDASTQHSAQVACLSKALSDFTFLGMQGWLHCILYVLFENAMGIVKLWACVAGAPPSPSSLA